MLRIKILASLSGTPNMTLNVNLFVILCLLKWEQSSALSCFSCVSYKTQENILCMDPITRDRPPASKTCRTGEKCIKILGIDKNNNYQVVRDCQQTIKLAQTDSYAITAYVFGSNRFNGKLWVCDERNLCNGSRRGAPAPFLRFLVFVILIHASFAAFPLR